MYLFTHVIVQGRKKKKVYRCSITIRRLEAAKNLHTLLSLYQMNFQCRIYTLGNRLLQFQQILFFIQRMPLLNVHLSVNLSPSQTETLVKEGSRTLAEETGKSLEYVMVRICRSETISFAGDAKTATAYMEVKNVGKLSGEQTKAISRRLCELLTRTVHVSADRTYLEFQESERRLWGWNGSTFE